MVYGTTGVITKMLFLSEELSEVLNHVLGLSN